MRRPLPSRPRAARGQITWVTVFLILAVGGGGYMGWVWIPVYIYKFQAEQVVRDFMNQAVKNRADRMLVENMVRKLRSLGTVELAGEDGTRKPRPAVDVTPNDITWERDARATPPTLHVAFDYTARVEYPWLERQDEKLVSIDLTQDISIPDWGPSR
ncbi:hypothetical protein [Anaeromyxobacter oryzae]|uniref:Uncharacterized protein n=1 Tax=Anaeromyxobacter oryzae TaxID=2918170 RepID=A0ABN6MZT3_9BACT|nr:hypothetical protein [Anaeromyxobacter oryzae]BDG06470.1 hypothetical protein AMOR_54660 [Anaeromyxobacter oryzae]